MLWEGHRAVVEELSLEREARTALRGVDTVRVEHEEVDAGVYASALEMRAGSVAEEGDAALGKFGWEVPGVVVQRRFFSGGVHGDGRRAVARKTARRRMTRHAWA